jgi:hypothetical protein
VTKAKVESRRRVSNPCPMFTGWLAGLRPGDGLGPGAFFGRAMFTLRAARVSSHRILLRVVPLGVVQSRFAKRLLPLTLGEPALLVVARPPEEAGTALALNPPPLGTPQSRAVRSALSDPLSADRHRRLNCDYPSEPELSTPVLRCADPDALPKAIAHPMSPREDSSERVFSREPETGLEPVTSCLQDRCSTN